jgi:hypothetical protein
MWKQVATLVIILAASASLARGQSVEREVAPDAEAAEELEALKRPPRVWARGEFLLWWIRPINLPPLVTTGPFTELRPGALDSPNTQILYGQRGMDFQDRTGGRFTFGAWLDDDQVWSVSAGYFFLRGRSIGQGFSSPGAPVLATPFFNTNTGTQDSSLITFPGIMSGQVVIDAPSFLQGADVNLNANLWENGWLRWEGSLGFRYLYLGEQLNIHSVSVVDVADQFKGFGIPFDGNTITVGDSFETRNHFYGGQLGTRVELEHKRFTLDLFGKVALGVTHQIANIHGNTTIDTTPAFVQNGGLFAVSSNSGRFTSNAFTVVPEVGVNLKFRLTERLQLFGGYSFLYWSRVARPADQIDTTVNPNFVPTSTTFGAAGGPHRPAFSFNSTDFFAHGANFGFEFRY